MKLSAWRVWVWAADFSRGDAMVFANPATQWSEIHVSVPWVVTHLNLVSNLHFVQLSPLNSTFPALQEGILLIPRLHYMFFKLGEGFWIVAVVLHQCAACLLQSPVLRTPLGRTKAVCTVLDALGFSFPVDLLPETTSLGMCCTAKTYKTHKCAMQLHKCKQ